MPREKEGFREQLEDIHTFFNGRRVLSVSDVVKYTGLCDKTVVKRYDIDPKIGVTSVLLAKKLIT